MNKNNFNIGSIIIVIILLQLGVRGFKEINKKFKAKKNSEIYQLCIKNNKNEDRCLRKGVPPNFLKLVNKIKKEKLNKEK
jgi:hypothetical protein|tara:strand:- start:56 stop:295 length:240 start_codon:yes stop_codon:yes gene_type:complete